MLFSTKKNLCFRLKFYMRTKMLQVNSIKSIICFKNKFLRYFKDNNFLKLIDLIVLVTKNKLYLYMTTIVLFVLIRL